MVVFFSLFGWILLLVGIVLILASWTYLCQWAHQGPKKASSHFMEKGLLLVGLILIAGTILRG